MEARACYQGPRGPAERQQEGIDGYGIEGLCVDGCRAEKGSESFVVRRLSQMQLQVGKMKVREADRARGPQRKHELGALIFSHKEKN